MSKDKNNLEIDLNKYKDLEGLSLKKMNFGLWLSEHRAQIGKFFIIFLIAISAFFFIFTSYNYFVYFRNSSLKADDIASTISNVVSQRNIASDITYGIPQIFRSGENYDLVVLIKNPNDKFTAHFQYCFATSEKNIKCSSGFIMPLEEKYIFALGQKIQTASPVVSFKITSTSWQRIDTHQIADWSSYFNSHINFAFENINLALADESGLSEKIGLDSLEFTAINRSNFGYYEVPFNISFYSGSELIGVNRYIIKNFLAGESRTVRMSWLGGLSSNIRTEIRPELDLLDDSIYLKYQGAK
ncbi:MAG: hypothetical protein WCN88_01130 [Candidatus Falkowbacteria bacterium]